MLGVLHVKMMSIVIAESEDTIGAFLKPTGAELDSETATLLCEVSKKALQQAPILLIAFQQLAQNLGAATIQSMGFDGAAYVEGPAPRGEH